MDGRQSALTTQALQCQQCEKGCQQHGSACIYIAGDWELASLFLLGVLMMIFCLHSRLQGRQSLSCGLKYYKLYVFHRSVWILDYYLITAHFPEFRVRPVVQNEPSVDLWGRWSERNMGFFSIDVKDQLFLYCVGIDLEMCYAYKERSYEGKT